MSRDRFRPLSEYDDTLGGLIPSIGAQAVPGLEGRGAVLPETEDWEAFGDTPGATELAESQAERTPEGRTRLQREALRAMRERRRAAESASPGDPLSSLQMDPADVEEAGAWFDENIGDPTRAGAASLLDALVLPRAALGALNEATGVDDYGSTVQRAREGAAEARAEHPWPSAVGTLGAMPAALISPQIGVSATAPATARVGAAGLESMGYGALPGIVSGDAEEAARGGINAGTFGGALSTLGAGAQQLVPSLSRAADALDEWSAPYRARAAGVWGDAAQRRVAQLPGGTRGYVRDLDRTGISRRGSISRLEDVGARADDVRQQAIGGIQGTRDRMAEVEAFGLPADQLAAMRSQLDEAVRLDDPSFAPTDEARRALISDRVRRASGARRTALDERVAEIEQMRRELSDLESQRAGAVTNPGSMEDDLLRAVGDDTVPGRPGARGMGDDPTLPGGPAARLLALRNELGVGSGRGIPSVRPDDVRRGLDENELTMVGGRLRHVPGVRPTGMPARDAQSPSIDDLAATLPRESGAGTVSGPEVASRLRGIVEPYREIPGAEGLYRAGEDLANQMEARGQLSWGDAERIRRFWDDITNWRAPGPTAAPLAPLQGVRRQMRGALQGVLDDAVAQNAPEIADSYRQARRDYQISDLTGRLVRDAERRSASNRLISPSDMGAGIMGAGAGGATGDPVNSLAGAALGVFANRFVRGREHALRAAAAERSADALRAVPQFSAGRATAPIAGAMGAAPQSPAPRQRPQAQPAPSFDEELDSILGTGPAEAGPSQPAQTDFDDELDEILYGGAP
jgi:hypothetical protein